MKVCLLLLWMLCISAMAYAQDNKTTTLKRQRIEKRAAKKENQQKLDYKKSPILFDEHQFGENYLALKNKKMTKKNMEAIYVVPKAPMDNMPVVKPKNNSHMPVVVPDSSIHYHIKIAH